MGNACGSILSEGDLTHWPIGKGRLLARYGGISGFKELVDLLFAKILRHEVLGKRFTGCNIEHIKAKFTN